MPSASSPKPKRQIGARVESDLMMEVRILALRQRRRVNELIEEALRDLLEKHKVKRSK